MKVRLASIFTNHMVLQREKPINIFGKGEPGHQIKVNFAGTEKVTEVDRQGNWKVSYKAFSAGGPYEISVKDESALEEFQISDVMIGDVYVAAGQSNMEFLFENSLGAEQEKANAEYKNFRYYKVSQTEYMKDGKEYPETENEGWFACTPQTVGKISGVAYYFAKEVMKHTDVTIGIVGCHKGGTSASCWLSTEYLKKSSVIQELYYDNYWSDISQQTDEEEDQARSQYQKLLEEYNQKVEAYQIKYPERSMSQLKHDVGHTPWPGPKGKKDFGRPCGLYETMFQKILGLSYRAVLWYQGEEDTKYADSYKDLLLNLIENWRKDLKDPNLPFFVMQLPDYNDDKMPYNWAILREQQRIAVNESKNTELVCALGCGEEFNIHPADKSEIGRRLGVMVVECFYDSSVQGHSPELVQVEQKEMLYQLKFRHTYGETLESNIIPVYLEVSYDGIKYELVKANIDRNYIIVKSERQIKQIRYAWGNYPKVYLMGRNQLPVIPFRYVIEGKDLKK